MKKNNSELISNLENSASRISNMKIFNFTISTRTIAILITSAIVLLACISGIVLNLEKDDKTKTTEVSSTDTDASSTDEAITTLSSTVNDFKANLLLILTDDDSKDINMLITVNIDTNKNSMDFIFVPTETVVKIGQETNSIQNHYDTYGTEQIIWAVGEHAGISVERYIKTTQKSFTSILSLIGQQEIEIDQDASYNFNGLNYVFTKGKQVFAPDVVMKYLLYLNSQGSRSQEKLTEILMSYLNGFLQETSVDDAYQSVIPLIETNVSAYDIVQHKDAVERYIYDDEETQINVVDNFDSFK